MQKSAAVSRSRQAMSNIDSLKRVFTHGVKRLIAAECLVRHGITRTPVENPLPGGESLSYGRNIRSPTTTIMSFPQPFFNPLHTFPPTWISSFFSSSISTAMGYRESSDALSVVAITVLLLSRAVSRILINAKTLYQKTQISGGNTLCSQ